jgi:hypothetical protein
MRLLGIVGLVVAMGMAAAPASACPITRDGSMVHRPVRTRTVLLYAEPGGPWRIAGESGLLGNGSGRYEIPLLERPVLGLRYAIVDIGVVSGGGQLSLRSGARRWAGLPVDIGEPVGGVSRWMLRGPDLLEPAAPAWHTALLAGGVIGLLGLVVLRVRWRRGSHAVAVP